MIPNAYPLEIFKGQVNPLHFGFFTGVNADEALDMTGSRFRLVVYDAVGGLCLSTEVDPDSDNIVRFPLTVAQGDAIPAGTNRYELARLIGDNMETLAYGPFKVVGGR
ncbi:hypothetical protein [Asticcacaulis sp. YBE204]|uniref:hypothetical protein n=1 Tax=Asticcacaulis sp. YBE204 TaxID=1282363 RepID=UPI0003C401C4|nr:hypothetical protein [Asticcacaulis sp. YBE204]ESQ78501.1 hypothetical protein AEYBE204_13190 [Asticcacaulis sp. YBE204]